MLVPKKCHNRTEPSTHQFSVVRNNRLRNYQEGAGDGNDELQVVDDPCRFLKCQDRVLVKAAVKISVLQVQALKERPPSCYKNTQNYHLVSTVWNTIRDRCHKQLSSWVANNVETENYKWRFIPCPELRRRMTGRTRRQSIGSCGSSFTLLFTQNELLQWRMVKRNK